MDPESLPCEGAWNSFKNEQDEEQEVLQMFWHDHNAHSYSSFDDTNSNQYYVPSSYQFPLSDNYGGYNLSGHNMVFSTSVNSAPMGFCIAEEQITAPSFLVDDPYRQFQRHVCLMEDTGSHEAERESSEKPQFQLPLSRHGSKTSKKRASTGDLELPEMTRRDDGHIVSSLRKKPRAFSSVPKKLKNSQSKKAQNSFGTLNDDDEEEVNADPNAQNSSSCSSEDEAKCSKSNLKASAALNQKEKSRAGRGSATDPQSIYARKRRERINERLRTLQNLVPNGTKVDISTMLEEAVQYVKFLQLQIKLLSSNDLWMYAPIAYNGMNIELDLIKNSPSLKN